MQKPVKPTLRVAGCLVLLAANLLPSCSPAKPDRETLEAYAKAKGLYLERRWDEALAVLRKNGVADLPAASLLLGKLLLFKGDEAGAETAFGKLIEKRPDYEEARKWLARLLILRGRPAEAEKILAEALALDAEDAELLTLLGKARLGKQGHGGRGRMLHQGGDLLRAPRGGAARARGPVPRFRPAGKKPRPARTRRGPLGQGERPAQVG